MKTIVYQSYRTTDVPGWVSRCMASVQSWAALRGFDYRFVDDELFGYAPAWYRQKVANNILIVSDLARLVLAKKYLREGFERTIWVDADVLVFGPRQFTIDIRSDFAFCRELWVFPNGKGLEGKLCVNNAVSVFVEPNAFLDFYIHACEAIVRTRDNLTNVEVGTRFLTGLAAVLPLQLINHVGMFSPILMEQLRRTPAATLEAYRKGSGFPIYAGNLCSSYRNKEYQGVKMNDDLYNSVVDNLLNSPHGPAHEV